MTNLFGSKSYKAFQATYDPKSRLLRLFESSAKKASNSPKIAFNVKSMAAGSQEDPKKERCP